MRFLAVLILMLATVHLACAAPMTLDYVCRYNCQSSQGVDHLLTAIGIGNNRAIIAGYQALALVDINSLISDPNSYIFRLTGLNARNLYLHGNYVFVNLNAFGSAGASAWGFAVVRIDGDTLTKVKTVGESGTLLEKMCISGNYLYVTAHSRGIRVFDITNPANPVQVGSLDDPRFVDCFDIAVSGNTAYVADGAGGLKVVDVGNPASPVYVNGEDLNTAVGTAQSVTVRDGKVYLALGTGGLAVYDGGDLSSRQVISTNGAFAEDMAWVGDYLAVSTYPGIRIFDVSGGLPTLVASDNSTRRGSGTLRICCGVGAAENNRVLVADWNYTDIYELKPASQSTQADINGSQQRIRFPAAQTTQLVTLSNNGRGNLNISSVSAPSGISVNYSGGTLAPGQSTSFGITYNGTSSVSGAVQFAANDPDENPLPVQVFAGTANLDPGEPAVDFTLPLQSRDPVTSQWTETSFTLSQQRGKVVFFNVYGSW